MLDSMEGDIPALETRLQEEFLPALKTSLPGVYDVLEPAPGSKNVLEIHVRGLHEQPTTQVVRDRVNTQLGQIGLAVRNIIPEIINSESFKGAYKLEDITESILLNVDYDKDEDLLRITAHNQSNTPMI